MLLSNRYNEQVIGATACTRAVLTEDASKNMVWLECGVVFAVAIIVTIALTPVAKRIAIATDAIDYPDNRRVNTSPTPRMGGIALFGGMVASCVVIIVGSWLFDWIDPFRTYSTTNVNFPLLGLGVFIIFCVGIVDDIKGLKATIKLVGQIIAATVCASSGLLLSNIQNPFIEGAFIEFGWLSYPITIFYLVAFANIINLIDGLDGLASGISGISAGTIFVFAAFAGRIDAAIFAVIIVGVCIGFLRYNHHPASIFMGDSGSLLLGTALGIVSLLAVARSTLFISLLVPIMAAGVPITDTAVAIIRRKRAHQRVDQPDRGHIHHRLLNAGFSQQGTMVIMCAWTAALSVCAIVLAESDGLWRVGAILAAAIITAYAIGKLHLLEPVLRHHYVPRSKRTQTSRKPPTNVQTAQLRNRQRQESASERTASRQDPTPNTSSRSQRSSYDQSKRSSRPRR